MKEEEEKTEAILSLGSNQGDRSAWLAFAVRVLSAHPHTEVTAVSPVYKTEPVDVLPEFSKAQYFNEIVACETDLSVQEFSDFIHRIEHEAGRVRGDTPNSPRTLDIDIITFGNVRMETEELTLPHPRALSRRFVLQPLADIKPSFHFPDDPLTVSEHLAKLSDHPSSVVLVDDRLLKTKVSTKWNYPF